MDLNVTNVSHLKRVKGYLNVIMCVGIRHTQSYLECHTSWVAQLSVKQPRMLWHNRICNLRKLTHNHKNIRKWTSHAAQQPWNNLKFLLYIHSCIKNNWKQSPISCKLNATTTSTKSLQCHFTSKVLLTQKWHNVTTWSYLKQLNT